MADSNDSFTIRQAIVDDALAIAKIHVETWRATYKGILPQHLLANLSVEDRQRTWMKRLEQAMDTGASGGILVAATASRAIGFCRWAPVDDGTATSELVSLYIDPAWWRKGVGHALQTKALSQIHAEDFEKVLLWVAAANKGARLFYERTGWILTGNTKDDVFDDVSVPLVQYTQTLKPERAS